MVLKRLGFRSADVTVRTRERFRRDAIAVHRVNPAQDVLELVIPPQTDWVAQCQSALHLVPGSIPGLAFSFSPYKMGKRLTRVTA